MTRKLIQCSVILFAVAALAGADWRQFRGTHSNSVAGDKIVPTTWSEEENVAWKVDLPGRGPGSPIVVDGRVVVTASSGVKQDRLHVLCYDTTSGEKLWDRQFWATGRTLTHRTSAVAAPTPASDGERIFAFYSSNDLVCLDLDGNLLWYRGLAHDYPKAGNDVGMSSSPVVIGKTVVVQIECQGDSFAAGINTQTGETRWRVERDRRANWCSPIAVGGKGAGADLVLLQSPGGLSAHDAMTGELAWRRDIPCEGIPSSTAVDGVVYVPSSGIRALEIGSDGRSVKQLWTTSQLSPGAASPIVYQGLIYAVSRSGIVTCANVQTGRPQWQLRLKGSFWGTPVIAYDHLYCINDRGEGQVVQLGVNEGKLVATNKLDGTIQASPVVSDGALFVRSDGHLWKIAK